MSLKSEIINIFDTIAAILEFKGDNPFKVNAYRNGANIIKAIEGDLADVISSGEIKHIKGIGKGLLSVIEEYYEYGYSSEYNELLSAVPKGILDFLRINGLGAKKIKTIYTELGIKDLDALERACREDRISALKGFGRKTQEQILAEIYRINSTRDLHLQSSGRAAADAVQLMLKKITGLKESVISGELRRGNEVISSVEFVLLAEDHIKAEAEIKNIFKITEAFLPEKRHSSLAGSDLRNSKALALEPVNNIPVYFYLASSEKEFYLLLFHTTGSEGFIEKLIVNGNAAGIDSGEKDKLTSGSGYIIPEMREREYFEVPEELRRNSGLELTDFRGLMHFHTTWSDGQATLEEMCAAARDLGFSYAVVCDHSKSAFYANGLSEVRLTDQKAETKVVSEKLNFPVLQGIESDILPDGSLDYDAEFLKTFDFITVSVHSSFKMGEEEMTGRIIRAVENQYTDLLGHPTGRLLLSRPAYQVNMKKVIDACAANNVAIEINASPFRLDLDWRLIYYAREKGCLFSINPDAHSVSGINDIFYGIRTARKGGLQPSEVINCLDLAGFMKFTNRKVNRS